MLLVYPAEEEMRAALLVLAVGLLMTGCAFRTITRDGQPVTVLCETSWHGWYLLGPEFACERAR
jgi:hypothetical protein